MCDRVRWNCHLIWTDSLDECAWSRSLSPSAFPSLTCHTSVESTFATVHDIDIVYNVCLFSLRIASHPSSAIYHIRFCSFVCSLRNLDMYISTRSTINYTLPFQHPPHHRLQLAAIWFIKMHGHSYFCSVSIWVAESESQVFEHFAQFASFAFVRNVPCTIGKW